MKTCFSKKGFTLIELLIVIAIISILVTIGYASLSRAQISARDAERRSELRNVAQALEQFYSDNNQYPVAIFRRIAVNTSASPGSCNATIGLTAFVWGSGNFRCEGRVYSSQLPQDPLAGPNLSTPMRTYRYATCGSNQVYALFADLERNPTTLPTPPTGCSLQGSEDFVITPQN